MKTTSEMQRGLLHGLDKWKVALAEAYQGVEQAIKEERWDDVATLMAQISQKTAQTGINLRNALAKNRMLTDAAE